ncbi:MAG: SDR family oxidoreductase [Hyphomicrobiales bacterium]|jgi:NAD(P)-dependent dehydrogenase (short-subunit alcohol dehydrogenase family)|nr:SDR family oxidoreductase [Hyphomicrobiales bacterium]
MTLPLTPSFQLDGRRALVTGAGRGIGLAIAAALAGAGAAVTLCARSAGEIKAAVAAIRARGEHAEALVLDVSDLDAATAALAARPAFDILVNNAGMNRPTPFTDVTVSDYDQIMGLNVRAAFFLSQAVARGMIAAEKRGVILNVSSQMGHVGGIDRTVYAASKHAIEGLTKTMAIELGPKGIRVNSIGPTFIRTELTAATFANPERLAWIRSKIKLDRVGEVEDIMGAAVFLASDAAALITGTSLLIDGGWTAG